MNMKKNAILPIITIVTILANAQALADYIWTKNAPKKPIKQLEYELNTANNKVKKLLLKLENLEVQAKVKQLKMQSLREEFNQDINKYLSKIKDLEQQLVKMNDVQQENVHLVKELKDLTTNNEQLVNKISVLEAKIIRLNKTSANKVNELNNQLKKKAQQINKIKTSNNQLSEQIKIATNENERLTNKVSTLREEIAKLDQNNTNSINKLNVQLKKQVDLNKQFQQRVKQLQQDITNKQEEIELVNSELRKTSIDAQKQRKISGDKQQQIDQLNTQANTIKELIAYYKDQAQNYQTNLSTLKEELIQEQKLRQKLEQALDIKSVQLDDMILTQENTKLELKTFMASKKDHNAIIAELKSLIANQKQKSNEQKRLFNTHYLGLCNDFNGIAQTQKRIDCNKVLH